MAPKTPKPFWTNPKPSHADRGRTQRHSHPPEARGWDQSYISVFKFLAERLALRRNGIKCVLAAGHLSMDFAYICFSNSSLCAGQLDSHFVCSKLILKEA